MNDIFNRNNGFLFDEISNPNNAIFGAVMSTGDDFEIIKEMVPNTLQMEIEYIYQSKDMTRQEQQKASKMLRDEYIDNFSKCEKIYSRRKTKNYFLGLTAMIGAAVLFNMLGGQGTMNGLTSLLPVKHIIK